MNGIDLLPLAVALLIGIPALGSCIGIGLASMKLLEGCVRQPELSRRTEAPMKLRRVGGSTQADAAPLHMGFAMA